ncbi:YwqJ-related putative deaminase [Kribbella sp. NPDC055071]
MITRTEAEQIAARWIADTAGAVPEPVAKVHEFELGYVVTPRPAGLGVARGIVDAETGELSVWPSLPLAAVMEMYRAHRAEEPPAPRTWDPADQIRADLRRVGTPATVTELRYGERLIVARSLKGPAEPNHHPLVRDFFTAELPAEYRERGHTRCSHAAALSDALHAEDARRAAAGAPNVGLSEVRAELFRDAELITRRIRERGDPAAGLLALPCVSCALLMLHLGIDVREGGIDDVSLSPGGRDRAGRGRLVPGPAR